MHESWTLEVATYGALLDISQSQKCSTPKMDEHDKVETILEMLPLVLGEWFVTYNVTMILLFY